MNFVEKEFKQTKSASFLFKEWIPDWLNMRRHGWSGDRKPEWSLVDDGERVEETLA